MNCRQAHDLFGAYWDDELTQAEREWLESHFASCPGCRREYDQFALTLETLAQHPRVEVSAGFAERVVAEARRRSPAADRMPAGTPRWIPITATAALLAVLGGMVMQWSGMPLAPRRPAPVALQQPVLVEPPPAGQNQAVRQAAPATQEQADLMASQVSAVDSLFDHAEDVEFILDPVTLRKGRAHTVVRPAEPARGEQALITF